MYEHDLHILKKNISRNIFFFSELLLTKKKDQVREMRGKFNNYALKSKGKQDSIKYTILKFLERGFEKRIGIR